MRSGSNRVGHLRCVASDWKKPGVWRAKPFIRTRWERKGDPRFRRLLKVELWRPISVKRCEEGSMPARLKLPSGTRYQ